MRLRLIVGVTIAIILNLAVINGARAEQSMTNLNITTPPIARISCTQQLCQSFRIIEEMAPAFISVGNRIKSHLHFPQNLGDRLFNLNEKAGVACLVDGQGSEDGSIYCGMLDKY